MRGGWGGQTDRVCCARLDTHRDCVRAQRHREHRARSWDGPNRTMGKRGIRCGHTAQCFRQPNGGRPRAWHSQPDKDTPQHGTCDKDKTMYGMLQWWEQAHRQLDNRTRVLAKVCCFEQAQLHAHLGKHSSIGPQRAVTLYWFVLQFKVSKNCQIHCTGKCGRLKTGLD